ncbi:MAG: exodeoxyribonuclease VII small subunit [Bacteroidota bacterium]
MSKKKEAITSYEEAMAELKGIVQQFQEELINVDQLPEKVKRAATLIRYCQDKLRSTENEIEQLLGED